MPLSPVLLRCTQQPAELFPSENLDLRSLGGWSGERISRARPAAGLRIISPSSTARARMLCSRLSVTSRVARARGRFLGVSRLPGCGELRETLAHALPFTLSGQGCLETPEGRMSGRAGEGMVIRGDLPMIIRATGNEIRRNFTLILHDSAKAATMRVDDWKLAGLCAN